MKFKPYVIGASLGIAIVAPPVVYPQQNSISQELVRLVQDYAKSGKPVITSQGALQPLDPKNNRQTFRIQLWNGSNVLEAAVIRLDDLQPTFSRAYNVKPSPMSLSITSEQYFALMPPGDERYRNYGIYLCRFDGYANVYNDFDLDGRPDMCFVNSPIKYRPLTKGPGIDLSNDTIDTIMHSQCQPLFEKEAKRFIAALKEYEAQRR